MSVGVVLESTTVQTSLFTKTSDAFTVVVGKPIHLEDALSDIGCTHKVDFEEFGLQVAILRSVCNQCLKKEGSSFLDLAALKEYLDNLVNRSSGLVPTFSVSDHLCQANSCFGVNRDDVAEDLDEIGSEVNFLAVGNDLIVLISLN